MSQPDEPPVAGVGADSVVVAAIVLGGVFIAVYPQHALSVVQIVLVTVVVVAGWHVGIRVARSRARHWSTSPFERTAKHTTVGAVPSPVEQLRSQFRYTRDRSPNVELPWALWRQLTPLIETAFERRGLDLADPAQRAAARSLVSDLTWAVLTEEPEQSGGRPARADARRAAAVVHAVLDDLDELDDADRLAVAEARPGGGSR